MATISARGYVSKVETKTSGGGTTYTKFTLSVKQKRKDKNGQQVVENIYLNCLDFSGKEIPGLHMGDRGTLTAYVGITGYLTVTGWCKDGKGGANLDVTVKEYEEIEQRGGGASPAPQASNNAPPADPFDLDS